MKKQQKNTVYNKLVFFFLLISRVQRKRIKNAIVLNNKWKINSFYLYQTKVCKWVFTYFKWIKKTHSCGWCENRWWFWYGNLNDSSGFENQKEKNPKCTQAFEVHINIPQFDWQIFWKGRLLSFNTHAKYINFNATILTEVTKECL